MNWTQDQLGGEGGGAGQALGRCVSGTHPTLPRLPIRNPNDLRCDPTHPNPMRAGEGGRDLLNTCAQITIRVQPMPSPVAGTFFVSITQHSFPTGIKRKHGRLCFERLQKRTRRLIIEEMTYVWGWDPFVRWAFQCKS